ncbi:MAG: cyclic nucleotide-binding/CBS domain-containing protein, partial [Candidatus Sedimenticola sp. 6PFRAG5]
MEIELLEIRDFLASHHPFDQLSESALSELPGKLQVRYYRRDSAIPDSGSLESFLYIVRTGAVELCNEGELLARLGEGDMLGYRASSLETAS